MEIFEVEFTEYAKIIKNPYFIFASAAFNELNRSKCNDVFYLLFKDSKYRLGIVGGIQNNRFFSPFSAPFGGFTFLSADVRLQAIEDALDLLQKWATDKGLKSISITLPPAIYNESFIAKQSNCMYRKAYALSTLDLNYAFLVDLFGANYTDLIWRNGRKNLQIALSQGLSFFECKTDKEKKLAYDIISRNREAKGYALQLTWQQVSETSNIITADFFMVKLEQGEVIASAIIFHVNQEVVQVIYWGDLPQFNKLKTMNYLSFKVFEHYKAAGKKIVDIGPSTQNSLPNYGLCEFKESIACDISQKLCFSKNLEHGDPSC